MKKPQQYYLTIDELPLFNWIKCNEGKLEYVRKQIDEGNAEDDAAAFEAVYDEYLKLQGVSTSYMRIIESMKIKALNELEFVITGNRLKLSRAQIEEAKLGEMVKLMSGNAGVEKAIVHLSRWIGSHINSRTISTKEYFIMLSEYQTAHKTQ